MASIYWYDEVTTTDASTIVSRDLRADEIQLGAAEWPHSHLRTVQKF